MIKVVTIIALTSTGIGAQVAIEPPSASAEPANQVVEWNRNLLALVRTPEVRATVSREEAITDQFLSGGIPYYWNGFTLTATADHKSATAQVTSDFPRGSKCILRWQVHTEFLAFSHTLSRGPDAHSPHTDNLNWLNCKHRIRSVMPRCASGDCSFPLSHEMPKLLRRVL